MFGSARSKLKAWIVGGIGTIAALAVGGALGAFDAIQKPAVVLEPGQPVETGPWVVRPLRAYTVDKGVYGLPLKAGEKALVFEAEMTNRTAISSKDYFTTFRSTGGTDEKPFVVLVRDSTMSPALQPGLSERMAYVWGLPAGATPPDRFVLAVNGEIYKQRDNLYGAPGWYNEHVIGTVAMAVGIGPDTPDAKP
ncbi:hypothetical protein ACFWXH_17385 [Mesorhizobium sp. NPDC059054]|uniref:hypothetical protein n=1 Tax=Mesorhizobium sp. NPDC059054 TaxID=3346711 RepID=UPI0036BA2408